MLVQGQAHGNAEVLKCLVKTYSKLAEGCQREMSRAVRMALWEYKKGAALTGWCDADVEAIPNCQTALANPKNRYLSCCRKDKVVYCRAIQDDF